LVTLGFKELQKLFADFSAGHERACRQTVKPGILKEKPARRRVLGKPEQLSERRDADDQPDRCG
ncbi:MAG TPA: hypothetical protein PLW86_16885, partial [Rhodocyclaceae bacterium]|nr:hypothetical protein [Rhodocyclaceae bacterium]